MCDRRTIWKTPIYESSNRLKLKVGASFLSFQLQRNVPTIWWLVDPFEEENEEREILVVGTGWIGDADIFKHHLGTWQDLAGLVRHAFDLQKSNKKIKEAV